MTHKPEPAERERRMTDDSVGHDAVRSRYETFRYGRPGRADAGGSFVAGQPFAAATDAEDALMASLTIRFDDDGAYRLGDSFDRPSQVVNPPNGT